MNRERRIIIAALSLTAALFAPVLGRAQQVQHPYIYVTVLQVKHDNVTRRQWEASRRAFLCSRCSCSAWRISINRRPASR